MARFSSILLKLSGELLREGEDCFARQRLLDIASAVGAVVAAGTSVGIVVGGGNLIRGRDHGRQGSRADADHVGMLATVLNAAMLRFALEESGLRCRVFAPRAIPPVADAFDRSRARRALDAGEVVLLGGGTGNPYFSTDSAAALRALELACDVVLKGTMVDGVYDKDPRRHQDAVRFDQLSYDEVLRRDLQVMDQTAIALCRDHGMDVMVFDITRPRNLVSVVEGSLTGTLISSG
jgi:uridylate kinase